MRNAEQLGGYYEMPMAIVVRIVMTVMTVMVRVVVIAMTIAVLMAPAKAIADTLFIRRASFNMNVRNVVSRMAVPQGGPNPRYVSRVEQQ